MNLTTESRNPPPGPRSAATLVVLRDGTRGPEVLLTRRPDTMRFMGGAWVFPGGAVTAGDRDLGWEKAATLDAAAAAAALGTDDPAAALGAFVCAVRESFEEVGLILGRGPVERLARRDAASPRRFLMRCVELGIRLSLDHLVPAGRWVTPVASPIRFDALFFAARAPEEFVPDPDPREVAEWRWMTAREALEGLASGDATMAPPTIEVLRRLGEHSSVTEALGALERVAGDSGTPVNVGLAPLVRVVLAPNPGLMTGPGTNTYVVGGGRAAVIDPAVDDGPYLDAVCSGPDVASILVTHRHADHTGGIAALHARTGAPVRAYGSAVAGGLEVEPLGDGEVTAFGGARLRALHLPGHAPDHVCFLLEGVSPPSLFSGDNVLGEGTPVIVPPDGNLRAYLDSLARLRDLSFDRIYPGHFRPLDGGRRVIDDYLEHRRERDGAILEAITEAPRTVEEIVERVYADTPEPLRAVARYSVLAHLEMAEEDGRAARARDRWHKTMG